MVDNVTANAGSGGAVFATDDIGGVHFPRTKIAIGIDGTNDGDVSSSNPLPVSGTVTADLGATDNAVLDSIDAALAGTLTVDGSGVTQPISHAALTELAGAIDTEMQCDIVGALPAGNNNIGNVDIASGTVTAELSATDNAVLDSIDTAVNGTLTVDGSAVTQPISHAALTELAGAIDTEVQVDVVTLPPEVHSEDFDSGVGTDTTLAFGIAVPASGGAAVVPGDATAGLKVDLGADNDVTVSGTVDLGATDNAVLDSIDAAVNGTLTVDGSAVTQPVSAASLPLPTGAATSANQSTIIGHVDGIETVLGTIDADTGSIATDMGTLAGAVAGTEMQVDIVSGTVTANLGAIDNAVLDSIDAAINGTLTVDGSGVTQPVSAASLPLPAGAATAANQTTLIGHVDGIEGLLGTIDADTSLLAAALKAEDAAHTTGDNGLMALGVQQTGDAALAGTDGDYSPFQLDENGFLKVNIKAGAGSGGTATTDDAAFTAGAGSGTPAMGFFSADTVDAGDVGVLAMDASRRLLVSIEADNAGIGGGQQYTEDDVAPANPVGNALMAERDDALGGVTPVEGDWTHLFANANGALWTAIDGAVTANLSATDNAVLDSIDAAVNGTLTVDGSGVTQPVSAASLPLPTGAATSANQATANGSLADIETNTDFGAVTGGGVEASALRVTLANDSTGVLSVDDNGGSLTVDGTVTAELSAVDNAVLDSIDAAVNGTVTVDGSAVTQPVSAASLPLPAGAATAANQSTLIGHVDGIEGLLTTIDVDTGTLAGAVSGSEMQVDIVSGTVTANLGATDNAVLDDIEANTGGSTSHYRNVDANAEAAIKSSAGTLKWLHAMNMTAAVAYLHLYDATTASVSPGTTTPDFTFPLATQGDTNGAGFVLPAPIEFGTAITMVVTTTIDGSAGDPGANGVFVNAGYV